LIVGPGLDVIVVNFFERDRAPRGQATHLGRVGNEPAELETAPTAFI
jgi:hypothetical protein